MRRGAFLAEQAACAIRTGLGSFGDHSERSRPLGHNKGSQASDEVGKVGRGGSRGFILRAIKSDGRV